MIVDFAKRFQNAFGYMSKNVSRRLKDAGFTPDAVADDASLLLLDSDSAFDEVKIKNNGTELLFAFRSITDTDEYADVFATPPMLTIRRLKRLTVTPIDNSDAEVVERYANAPWEINWKGVLIDMDNHKFPLDKMEELNKMFEVNDIWAIESEILERIGVQSIYFSEISFEFLEGYEDTVAYTLTSRSIKPLEYQLINE